MDLVLQRKDVPKDFRERVDEILEQEIMGSENQRIWAKTNFGQHYVFVVSKMIWYAVRLIVDEEYWYYPAIYRQNIESDYIYEKKQFWTFENAKLYIEEKLKEISENKFGKELRYRLRKVPKGFLQNPDQYLNKGAQIQRYLKVTKITGIGSHEGIYLGNGEVAHMSADDGVNLTTKHKAYPRVDTLEKFLENPDEELRIVDHCFRQRDPESIVEIARTIVEEYSDLREYDLLPYIDGQLKTYNLFSNNCQHFATSCVIGDELMTEADHIVKSVKKVTIPSGIIIGLAVLAVCLEEPNDQESKNSDEPDETYDQPTWDCDENEKEK